MPVFQEYIAGLPAKLPTVARTDIVEQRKQQLGINPACTTRFSRLPKSRFQPVRDGSYNQTKKVLLLENTVSIQTSHSRLPRVRRGRAGAARGGRRGRRGGGRRGGN